ncbi:hypothetical protein PG996_007967 [Apiospora saccharicola]|uniref:Uncharacterized protein n=1 Tax=Apiospora saccharicola TaxID=335842 RepID=A0ABR1UWK2_9PEZI
MPPIPTPSLSDLSSCSVFHSSAARRPVVQAEVYALAAPGNVPDLALLRVGPYAQGKHLGRGAQQVAIREARHEPVGVGAAVGRGRARGHFGDADRVAVARDRVPLRDEQLVLQVLAQVEGRRVGRQALGLLHLGAGGALARGAALLEYRAGAAAEDLEVDGRAGRVGWLQFDVDDGVREGDLSKVQLRVGGRRGRGEHHRRRDAAKDGNVSQDFVGEDHGNSVCGDGIGGLGMLGFII